MVLNGRSKLQLTIEVYVVFIGGKVSGKRGRGDEGKSLIAVAVEVSRKTGKVSMANVPDASIKSLRSFIEKNVG